MDHIIIANECKYIQNEECQQSLNEIKDAMRILNGYIKYLHEARRKN
jgi:four helix bundle protein